jgi:hypothetical protein
MISKSQIENAAVSGLPLTCADVASVDAKRGVITLRHAWAEDCDARIWHGVIGPVRAEARRMADATGRAVEGHGDMGDAGGHETVKQALLVTGAQRVDPGRTRGMRREDLRHVAG